jgi:hypothetical protein
MDMIDNMLSSLANESIADRMLAEEAFNSFKKDTNEKTLQTLKDVFAIRAANRKKRLEVVKKMANCIPD